MSGHDPVIARYTLRLGSPSRPYPAVPYECGWCGAKFMTARELVAHADQERQALR